MSNERDHWSIGEVLALLQDEFPEITISKIRFLESQGLVSPERTPSGYRRFYDEDYDRLYWILKQQRDHYLPLRVIRDRLDGGVAISPAPRREMTLTPRRQETPSELAAEAGPTDVEAPVESQPSSEHPPSEQPSSEPSDPAGSGHSIADDAGSLGSGASNGNAAGDDAGDQAKTDERATLDDATSEEVVVEDDPTDGVADEMAGADLSGEDAEAETNDMGQSGDPAVPEVTQTSPEASRRESDNAALTGTQNSATVSAYLRAAGVRGFEAAEPEPTKDAAASASPSPSAPLPASPAAESATAPVEAAVTAAKPVPTVPPSIPGSSVALTREQLADQAGCTFGMVTDLEKYGMILGHHIGGNVLFDSTALTITRLAIEFNRYGIEPRHLKTFRLGAEREVELLAQGIGPTLRANNADTRRRSFETLNDLAELGASLRRILVRDLVAQHAPEG